MDPDRLCEIAECGETATVSCVNCGRGICPRHTVADYTNLPGGQRPYCAGCDAERRRLYQAARGRGFRAILWGVGGAVVGSAGGYLIGALASPDSFTHTVTTDLGFLAGLAVALLAAVRAPDLGSGHERH